MLNPLRVAAGLLFPGDNELREPQESALEIVIGEAIQLLHRKPGKPGCFLIGGLDRLIAAQNGENVFMADAVEGALLKHGLNPGALFRGTALKGMDYGEGGFAFAQVT